MIDGKRISDLAATLCQAKRVAFTCAEAEAVASEIMKMRRAHGYETKAIEGKNADERTASENKYLASEIQTLKECEANTRMARHNVEIAQIHFDALKLELRLLELTARQEPEPA